MVIAPSKKNTISLTSADACDSSETAISVDGAYRQMIEGGKLNSNVNMQWGIMREDTTGI